MRRVMLQGDGEQVRSCHVCQRRDCTRIFRASNGYSDHIDGAFDLSRATALTCPRCGAVLYLAEVDRAKKLEIWECPQRECDFSEESPSPSAR